LKTWYNDNNGQVTKDFGFRFRGKESVAYLKNFSKIDKNDFIKCF